MFIKLQTVLRVVCPPITHPPCTLLCSEVSPGSVHQPLMRGPGAHRCGGASCHGGMALRGWLCTAVVLWKQVPLLPSSRPSYSFFCPLSLAVSGAVRSFSMVRYAVFSLVPQHTSVLPDSSMWSAPWAGVAGHVHNALGGITVPILQCFSCNSAMFL